MVQRLRAGLSAVLVGLAVVVAPTLAHQSVAEAAVAAAAAVPPGGMSAVEAAGMFAAYGDAGGHWTGGDGTVSVLLPDGRVAWLFSDTFLGTVNADGSRPQSSPMVNNVLVVQDGATLVETRTGGSELFPEALVKSTGVAEFFWVADAVVESNELRVLYNRHRRYGTGSLDIELTGTSLARFTLPGLTLSSVVDLPVGKAISWGAAMLVDGAYTYIYGTSSALGGLKFGHVARAPVGSIGGAWQFWDGAGWSATATTAKRLLSGVGNTFAVQKVGSQYVVVTQDTNAVFDPQFVAYTAASPTGPFAGPIPLLTAPEQVPGTQRIVYAARLHPDLARPGKLLMSYDVGSLNPPDVFADARLYRPRFVELDWPRPAGPPLAAPTGLTVSADTAGVAHLRWTAVWGATGYFVYRRDVTGGQTHFYRQPQRLTNPAADIAGLVTAHRYEFRVTAASGVGESPLSTVVAATVRVVRDASVINLANTPEAVAGSYIVRFKDTPAVRGRGVEALARDLLAQSGGTLDLLFPLTLNGFSASLTEAQAIDLTGHPDVVDVEQDQTVELLEPSGELSAAGEQEGPPSWGLDRIDQRQLPLDDLYRYPNEGQNIHAYVLDTGVRINHPTFGGRASYGWNAINRNTNADDCDNNGHGTHVAATLGGTDFGAAKSVRIVAVKVFGCDFRSRNTSVADGVEWVTRNAQRPAVVNMSLSGKKGGSVANAVDRAVERAIASGLVVVASAGNKNSDACGLSPAHLPEVITVAYTNQFDQRYVFDPDNGSGYGPCVDIFAPGVSIVSAQANQTDLRRRTGASFAVPHVSGVAAMILQVHPSYGAADVADALRRSATGGLVENPRTINNFLLFVEQPPEDEPLGLVALSKPDGTIGLSWAPVLAPNIRYRVSQRDVTDGTPFVPWRHEVTGLTATATGLQEGHTYEFTVAATNTTGIGPESDVASAVARTQPPAAPTNLTATANANDGTITLRWDAPPGADLWYYVYQRDLSNNEDQPTKLPLPVIQCCTMTAGLLHHDHEYEFTVRAANRGGEGPPSNAARARAHYPLPAPPTGLVATEGDGQVSLRWTASITANVWYSVYQTDLTAKEKTATKLPIPVVMCCQMTAGFLTTEHVYEFKVTAFGPGGESTFSMTVQATPHKPLPPKVTGLTATANADGTITLLWTEPAGGPYWYEVHMRDVTAGETGFTKLPSPVGSCCTWVGGLLQHNHVYQFKVGATNGRTGPLSDVVQATCRYSLPNPPVNLRGMPVGDGMITLDWDPPGPGGFFYWIYWRDVTAGETAFTKSGLPTDKTSVTLGPYRHTHTYEFKVSSHNQAGEGPAGPLIRVISFGGLPLPPTGLTAQAGNGEVVLNWAASPSPNVWYLIEQRPAGGSWIRLSSPVTGCCTARPGYLANGTWYEFRVRATNASGDSDASNVVSARPMPPFPQPPTNVQGVASDTAVDLTWTASPTPGVWYVVDMRANGGDWQRLPYPIAGCCSWHGGLLVNGVTYEFRLRATNIAGDSAPSNVVALRPLPPFPQPPSGLTAAPGSGLATLRWTASPTPGVWYVVEQRVAGGGSWVRLPVPVTSCCSMEAGWLHNGTTYEFRIRATNAAGESAPSNVARTTPVWPRGSCSAVALVPRPVWHLENWWLVGSNSAACVGYVSHVVVSVTIWETPFSLAPFWASSHNWATWNEVPVSRYGYVDTWAFNLSWSCNLYIVEARTTWLDQWGQLGEAVNFSPTVQMRTNGEPCSTDG